MLQCHEQVSLQYGSKMNWKRNIDFFCFVFDFCLKIDMKRALGDTVHIKAHHNNKAIRNTPAYRCEQKFLAHRNPPVQVHLEWAR